MVTHLINIVIALASTLISTKAFAHLQRADLLHSIVVSCSAPASRTPAHGCQSSRFSVGLFMAEDPEVKKESSLNESRVQSSSRQSVPLVPLRILARLPMIHHGSEGGVGRSSKFWYSRIQGFVNNIMNPLGFSIWITQDLGSYP
jgi:hypothetical protein